MKAQEKAFALRTGQIFQDADRRIKGDRQRWILVQAILMNRVDVRAVFCVGEPTRAQFDRGHPSRISSVRLISNSYRFIREPA